MSSSFDKKMLSGFSREVKSYLPLIREGLEHFQNDSSHYEVLEDTLRYIHTIKGASALMGLISLSQIASYVEELLEEIMSGHINLDTFHNQWLALTIGQIDPYLECLLKGEGENQEIVELIESKYLKIKLDTVEIKSIENEYIDKNVIEDDNTFVSHSVSNENSIFLQESDRIIESDDESLPLSTGNDNNIQENCQQVFTLESYISGSKDKDKTLNNKNNYEKQYICENESKDRKFLSKLKTDNDNDSNTAIAYCGDEQEVDSKSNLEKIRDGIVGENNDEDSSNTMEEENNSSALESKDIKRVSHDEDCSKILYKQSSIDLTPSESEKVYFSKEFGSQDAHDTVSQAHGIIHQDEDQLYDIIENIDDIDDHESSDWGSHTGVETLDMNQNDSEVTSDSENEKTIYCQKDNTRVDDNSDGITNKEFEGISFRLDHDDSQIRHSTKTEEDIDDQEEPLETSTESSKALEEIIDSIDDSIRNTYQIKDHTSLRSLTRFNVNYSQRYLLFSIGGSNYAATVTNILEIGRVPPITPVPNVPDWLTGVVNLRGQILSVIDLGHFLDIGDSVKNDDNRLLIVRTEGGEVVTSLVVDQVNGFIQLDSARYENKSIIFHDKVTPYLNEIFELDGIILGILDLERFLQSSEICQFY